MSIGIHIHTCQQQYNVVTYTRLPWTYVCLYIVVRIIIYRCDTVDSFNIKSFVIIYSYMYIFMCIIILGKGICLMKIKNGIKRKRR